MNLVELFATLGVKLKEGEFTDVFSLLDKLEETFGKVFSVIEATITKGFEAIGKVAEQGDALATTAEKLGITAQAVQELGYAATLSDGSVESLENGLKFLAKNAAEAATKGGDAAAAFKGIKLREVNGQIRSVDALLADVADRFASTSDASTKTKLAMELFGRAGTELIPMLNRGANGISALRSEFRASGAELDGNTISAAERYDDQLKRLGTGLDGLRARFAGPLIPKVTALFDKLIATFKTEGAKRLIDGLSNAFGRFLVVLSGLVDLFAWVVESESRAELALFALTTVVAALTAGAVALTASMTAAAWATISAWASAAAPFLVVGGLIALIVDEIFTFIEGGDSMLGRLIKWLDDTTSTGSELLDVFKAAGSLLFDLTDPEKWSRLGRAIQTWVMLPLTKLVGAMRWVLSRLGLASVSESNEADKFKAEFPGLSDPLSLGNRSLGDAIKDKFPGLSDPFNSAVPIQEKFPGLASALDSGTVRVSGQANASSAPLSSGGGPVSINAPVSVQVATNADPNQIGEAVSRAVDAKFKGVVSELNSSVTN